MRKYCLVAPKEKAEEIRRDLLSKGLLEKHLKISSEGDSVIFPVRERFDSPFRLEERDVEEAPARISHYSEIADVPAELMSLLPSSWDIIGDIAIARLPDELRAYRPAIGQAILRAYKNVKCVFTDEGVQGEFRIRKLSHMAGEDRTRTLYREHGLTFAVDVSKAYFSPRLATERVRVTEQVNPGEAVLDLFTGVGPYAIMIAKRRDPSVVYAVDNNPAAFELLEENVRRNRADKVRPILADARQVLSTIGKVDRIILDLPQSASEFYLGALRALNPGGTLHYYEILEAAGMREREEWLRREAESVKVMIDTIRLKEVKAYSPTQRHIAFDIKIC